MTRQRDDKGAEASARPERYPLEKMPSKDEVIDIDVEHGGDVKVPAGKQF